MIAGMFKDMLTKTFGTDNFGIGDAILDISAFIGLSIVVIYYLRVLVASWKLTRRKGQDPRSYGKWAIVTGATDGIGKAYVFELAKRGMDVLLISRTESKLVELEKELSEKFPDRSFRHLAIDYSDFNKEARAKVEKAVSEIDDLGMLVNNVGMSYKFPEYFHLISDEDVANLITLNIDSTVWMTRSVLPKMLEQGRGAIINLSSGSGLDPCPLLSEYSAAKMFITRFSQSLNAEYESKGIFVQSLAPYFVVSKLSKQRKSAFVPTPEAWVKRAMTCLGGAPVENPHWAHYLVETAFTWLPSDTVAFRILKMHLSIRKRAYRKMERLANESGTKEEEKKTK